MTRTPVPLVKLAFVNTDPMISAGRKYLEDVIVSTFAGDPDSVSYGERLSTASAELLDNAQKFSPEASLIAVEVAQSTTRLRLRVTNSLRDDPSQVLACVRSEVESVWSEPDARAAFRKRVKISLADPEAKAMLGYAKVRMETGAQIRARIVPGSRLQVTLWFSRRGSRLPFVDSP